MSFTLLIVLLAGVVLVGYRLGRDKARGFRSEGRQLGSLPFYFGGYVVLWSVLPALAVIAGWIFLQPVVVDQLVVAGLPAEVRELPAERLDLYLNDLKNLATGNIVSGDPGPELAAAAERYRRLESLGAWSRALVVIVLAFAGAALAYRRVSPRLPAMHRVESAVRVLLGLGSTVAIFTTIGIVLSLLFEAIRFFRLVPFTEFLFGTTWSPQTALRADQVGSSGAFGAVPLLTGTLLITVIAMAVAVPVGLLSAVYLAEYSSRRARAILKPILEILAGVPTVVYGFFAALTVAPKIRDLGESLGLSVASESALAAGSVMGFMIIPFVSSLADDVITTVPRGLREASLGLGATRSETIRKVVFPAALPGIVGGILLAVSRAIGETMIVVMAAGLTANLTANPLAAVTTVTVQIVTLLVGDQEFDSAKTLAAFALGLTLFAITLVLNVIALVAVRRYREQYE